MKSITILFCDLFEYVNCLFFVFRPKQIILFPVVQAHVIFDTNYRIYILVLDL